MTAPLVPELDVRDLDRSLAFYVEVLGFRIAHQRPEEGFAYLERDGAELMLETAQGPGRRFRTAALEPPFGRGMNLQIRVADAPGLLASLAAAGRLPLIPLETRWYRAGHVELGNRQFVVADPDGYLLRFFEDLGERPLTGDLA
ncbi:VOC family protein [Phenylobacterium sp.]|uniref:bleomycin resistance protein n=1 Tax=Phenylobacterium sp. TaxID=1871053 RepID=UPI002DECB59C|nr:VOC family protein [Phenylobacterium sp.]